MLLGPIVGFVWQETFAAEVLKLLIGLTIGLVLTYFRDLFLRSIKIMVKKVKAVLIDGPVSIIKGAKLLGSENFQELPEKAKELQASVQSMAGRVKNIEGIVGPNGGKSLLDGVNQLKNMVGQLSYQLTALTLNVQQIVDSSDTLMFKCSNDGNFLWASKSLQELVALTFEDGFKGQQWENLYFPEDLPDIRRRWNDAAELSMNMDLGIEKIIEPKIILTLITKFRHNNSGDEIPVQLRLSKMPDGNLSGIVNLLYKSSK